MTGEGQRAATVQSVTDEGRTVIARAITYNVPDTYQTSWAPSCLNEGLRQSLPPVCYGHDHKRIVGKVTNWQDSPSGLDVEIRLADPEHVPDARMVQSLLRDGMLPGVSIGFADGKAEKDPNHRGVMRFRSAKLRELSFVAVPSVPGARVLSFRSEPDFFSKASADFGHLVNDGWHWDEVYALARATYDAGTAAERSAVESKLDRILDRSMDIESRLDRIVKHGSGKPRKPPVTRAQVQARREAQQRAAQPVKDPEREARWAKVRNSWEAQNFLESAALGETFTATLPHPVYPEPIYDPNTEQGRAQMDRWNNSTFTITLPPKTPDPDAWMTPQARYYKAWGVTSCMHADRVCDRCLQGC